MSLDPTALNIGPARIWLGGTAAPSGTVIGVDASGVPTNGGTEVGLTDSAAILTIGGDVTEIMVEQSLAPVRAVQKSEEASITFVAKEIDWLRVKNYLRGAQQTVTGTQKNTTGGGNACIPTFTVSMVGKDTCGSKYTTITLHKAYVSTETKISYSKAEETKIEVTFKGLADITRASGDQLYQVSQQY